ncbi:hypothetical protein OAX95_00490 [bacterium]|nr:hypothetical protein [bacterium]
MSLSTPTQPDRRLERHERIYRWLLIAYPRSFRDEYGDDLVQSFRDLMMFSTNSKGRWWRTLRDLVTSAPKERASMFSNGGKPPVALWFVVACVIAAAFIVGPGPLLPVILVPTLVLVALPIYGMTRFRQARLVRRTTGGAIAAQIALGVASFVPAAVVLALLGDDAGYWIFVAVGLGLIVGSAFGIVWAGITLVSNRGDRPSGHQWIRPALVLVPSVAVLGIIIGASYNSYRQSLGPPGDHSVDNASADTRSLWAAANAGDVDEVVRITADTCADPWVKFPVGNGRHNAKGQAETRELELPDAQEPPFRQVADILGDYMDDWHDRCGRAG